MRAFFTLTFHTLVSCGCLFLIGCDAGSSSAPADNGGSSAGGASGGSKSGGGAAPGAGAAALGGSSSNGGALGQAGSVSSAAGALGQAGAGGSGTAGSGNSSAGAPSGDCSGALICDDFEAYTGTPGGPWKVTKTSFGTVSIDSTQHRSGTKAVKLTTSGGKDPDFYQLAYISVEKIFPIANNAFYGRMMMYLTKAANDGVHWTMIEGEGPAAQGITNALVRYGGQHEQRLMANYDSTGKASDCWQHSATKMPEAKWACMEWYFDGATNTQKFWLDGQAIADLTVTDEGEGCVSQGTGGKWIYPSFTRLNLGWGSYAKDDPREAWIDDVAVDAKRIGCPTSQ